MKSFSIVRHPKTLPKRVKIDFISNQGDNRKNLMSVITGYRRKLRVR